MHGGFVTAPVCLLLFTRNGGSGSCNCSLQAAAQPYLQLFNPLTLHHCLAPSALLPPTVFLKLCSTRAETSGSHGDAFCRRRLTWNKTSGRRVLPITLFCISSCVSQLNLEKRWQMNISCTVECPVNCQLSEWSSWSECSQTCGLEGKFARLHRT